MNFRDLGIVIKIAVIQWILEFLHNIGLLAFIYFFNGYSHILDKFVALYMTTFYFVVLPSFYLSGDAEFRSILARKGFFSAIKMTLLNWNIFLVLLKKVKWIESREWQIGIGVYLSSSHRRHAVGGQKIVTLFVRQPVEDRSSTGCFIFPSRANWSTHDEVRSEKKARLKILKVA